MPKAVQLSAFGDVDRLTIVDVQKPVPASDQVLVRVIAAGTNPGEISIREGHLAAMFPMALPFGQGSDFAGRVEAVGASVTEFGAGDEVMGWSDQRSAQADYVSVAAAQLIPKPAALDWYRAGSLFVTGTTAVAAVNAVHLTARDVVAVSAAAGGVGSLAVQFAKRTGARVIGIAGERNAAFLRSLGVEPVTHGDGPMERLRQIAPDGITAFIDLFGDGYVDLALSLGIAARRINTIIDFEAAAKHGVSANGSSEGGGRDALRMIAERIAWGEIVMPLTAIYPFTAVHDAYRELAKRAARGKIALALDSAVTESLRAEAAD